MLHNSSLSFGKHHLHYTETTSTNDVAKQLLEQQLAHHGTLITASFQHNGKGQETNKWESESEKNLLCSVVLLPQLAVENHVYLNLVICLSVYDFVKATCPLMDVSIKWPNDIYVGNKKIAGVLIENTLQGNTIKQSIIGVGLNINQIEFETAQATSLSLLTSQMIDVGISTQNWLALMELRYTQLKNEQLAALWQQYHEVLYLKNKLVQFEHNATTFLGTVLGIDEHGRLLVNVNDNIQTFNVKELVWHTHII